MFVFQMKRKQTFFTMVKQIICKVTYFVETSLLRWVLFKIIYWMTKFNYLVTIEKLILWIAIVQFDVEYAKARTGSESQFK